MTDEELIEKARIAFVEAWEAERKKIGRDIAPPGTKSRAGILAALAVFREHTAPAGDERELMLSSIRAGMDYYMREDIPEDGLSEAEQIADFLADAGFRLVPRGAEDTDERLKIAADRMSPLSEEPYTSLDLALVREAAYRVADGTFVRRGAPAEPARQDFMPGVKP